jgi:hypothetical protein
MAEQRTARWESKIVTFGSLDLVLGFSVNQDVEKVSDETEAIAR